MQCGQVGFETSCRNISRLYLPFLRVWSAPLMAVVVCVWCLPLNPHDAGSGCPSLLRLGYLRKGIIKDGWRDTPLFWF